MRLELSLMLADTGQHLSMPVDARPMLPTLQAPINTVHTLRLVVDFSRLSLLTPTLAGWQPPTIAEPYILGQTYLAMHRATLAPADL
ncbi:hypothetical protein AURDEDRAFT_178226 [Auricularia subglabra TFB-10046 SS5]|uniref:Uncharacterized protein n=1 Tax=Auricularia subglabra (strain TFB-10046 / SS5) TaxID=717982 RepID=J0WLM2_AURST|nr:hypothetical protein AURDEDRAFT_178226 [Auricularia subglabra TFB-10046 SS5]